MTNIEIQGTNLDITDSINNYLNKRAKRIFDHGEQVIDHLKVNVSFEAKTGSHVVEFILFLNGNGKIFRCKESSDDMYTSIDLASAQAERLLRRYKEKKIDVKRHKSSVFKHCNVA